jgi:hypothetical protein
MLSMTHETGVDDKTLLLFRVVQEVGIAAISQLQREPRGIDDSWTSTQANRSLSFEMLQKLGPKTKPGIWNNCIRLPFFPKDGANWVPLLWIEVRHTLDVALQVVVAGAERRFGYRWEPPESEGPNKPSKHGYYHAQPITSVKLSGGAVRIPLNLKHQDISEHFPTIPVDARDGLELVDALLVSLYGPDYATEYINDPGIRNQFHKCTENCGWARCRKISGIPSNTSGETSGARSKGKRGKRS